MRIKHSHSEKNLLLLQDRSHTQELSLYKRLSLKKYEHFIQICEKIFQVNSFFYIIEDSHVVYVSQYLDNVFETEWNCFKHDEDLEHTWKEFKNFLLKTFKNSVNYKKDTSQHLTNICQYDTQFVQDFAHYLNILQD